MAAMTASALAVHIEASTRRRNPIASAICATPTSAAIMLGASTAISATASAVRGCALGFAADMIVAAPARKSDRSGEIRRSVADERADDFCFLRGFRTQSDPSRWLLQRSTAPFCGGAQPAA
ncbi:MAG: hypothetical protein R3C42_03170 [Parvularculaceae bacterium]